MFQSEFMERAVMLADMGLGKCSPNPAVGAVVVKSGRIIGEGFTQPYGGDHAEVQAIKNCTEDTEGADLYVTLEPCSHFGKTPPCVDFIYKAKIANVYAGIKDPNPKVDGKGFFMLKVAGINVEYPFYEEIIKKQLEYYLTWVQKKKPFVIMKNAVSLDGKIASKNGDSKWITSEASLKRVHALRNEVDAILTTINTVKKDNPMLNVRLDMVNKQPLRVVLDPFLEIEIQSNLCQTAETFKTIIFYDKNLVKKEKIDILNEKKINTIPVSANDEYLNIDEILFYLGEMKILSVLVEAGTKLNSYLLKNQYVNKLFYFLSPKILGGDKNVFDSLNIVDMKNQIKIYDANIEVIENDVLFIGYLNC